MKNTKRNFIIVLLVALGVMFFSFRNDYENIIKIFSNINYMWLIIAILIIIIYHLIDAYFIYYYCKGINKKYHFWNSIEAQQTFTFFNSITPFASGGQFAQIIVLKKHGINTKQSASMAMISFISWQTILVVFGLVVLVFNYASLAQTYSSFFGLVFLGFSINLAVITGLFLSVLSNKFHSFIINGIVPFLGKIKIFKDVKTKQEKTKIWLRMFKDEFNNLLVHRDLMIRRVVCDILKIFTFYSIPFFAALGLNIPLEISSLKIIIVLTSFVYMITAFVPLPGGSGGMEGVFILLLNPILGAATTSVMLMWRFLTYYIPTIIGFIIFASIKEFKE